MGAPNLGGVEGPVIPTTIEDPNEEKADLKRT